MFPRDGEPSLGDKLFELMKDPFSSQVRETVIHLSAI